MDYAAERGWPYEVVDAGWYFRADAWDVVDPEWQTDGRWFIGGTFTGLARTVDVPIRLGAGRWLVETVTDGPSGLVRETRAVRGGDTLAVPVTTNGGFAAIACRAHEGRTGCEN